MLVVKRTTTLHPSRMKPLSWYVQFFMTLNFPDDQGNKFSSVYNYDSLTLSFRTTKAHISWLSETFIKTFNNELDQKIVYSLSMHN